MARDLRAHPDRHPNPLVVVDAANPQGVDGEARGLLHCEAADLNQGLAHKRQEGRLGQAVRLVRDPHRATVRDPLHAARREQKGVSVRVRCAPAHMRGQHGGRNAGTQGDPRGRRLARLASGNEEEGARDLLLGAGGLA